MTTNPAALAFVSNAGTASRAFGDHIGEYVYNVKSFGAVGNDDGTGSGADDTLPIQACIDAAIQDNDSTRFWSYSTLPIGELYTRLIYFPPGIYKTTAPLLIPLNVHGGMIFGAGMGVSVINNVTASSIVINTQGFLNSTLRDISLWSAGGAGSICYRWDEIPGSGGGRCKEICWINVEFKSAEVGLRVGEFSQCDVSLVLNCLFKNHSLRGIDTHGGNVLSWVMLGGRVENCATGISIGAGGIPTIQNVTFANNTANDITNFYRLAVNVIGCHSTSPASNGFIATNGPAKLVGCTHTGGTGFFVNIAASFLTAVSGINTVCLDACSSTSGTFIGASDTKVYARGCTFAANAFTAVPYGGTVVENI